MTLLFLPVISTVVLAAIVLIVGRGRGAIMLASGGTWFTLMIALGISVWSALAGHPSDGLAIGLTLLTLFVGAIVLTFSARYLRADQNAQPYAVKVLLLLAAILTFVVADNVYLFALGWLASGWLLVSLIGHVRGWNEGRNASHRAIVRFTVGDVALVCSLGLLAWQAQSTSIRDIVAIAPQNPGFATGAAALLLVIAAMARCASPPFSRWLTLSMTAPTPVSALMHAGFVNAGGFLLVRFGEVLEAAPAAQLLAVGAGVFAALWGTGIMLIRPDIKRSLAGSTVAQMGFMLMTSGLGAYAAALWHLIAHGLFKAWLFLGSGSAIGTGWRDPAARQRPVMIAGAAALALSVGIAMMVFGIPSAALISIVLAFATGLATLAGIGRARTLVLPLLGVVAFYGGGLWLTEMALERPYGASPGGDYLALGLVLIFLACWILQALFAQSTRQLPPRLYARLLGA